MTDYFVDHRGNNTTGTSWETAFTSVFDMQAHATNPRGTVGAPLTNTDRLIFGSDCIDSATYVTNVIITGPSAGVCEVLSSLAGTGTAVSYAIGTTYQIDMKTIAFYLQWNGGFAIYGVKHFAGNHVSLATGGSGNTLYTEDCYFNLGEGGYINFSGGSYNSTYHVRPIIDLTRDGTTGRTGVVLNATQGWVEIIDPSFINAAYRTTTICGTDQFGDLFISGGDFSEFPASAKMFSGTGVSQISNSLVSPSIAVSTGSHWKMLHNMSNCGSGTNPVISSTYQYAGSIVSTKDIVRVNGGSLNNLPFSFKAVSGVGNKSVFPLRGVWCYEKVPTLGDYILKVAIANNTRLLNNNEIFIQAEIPFQPPKTKFFSGVKAPGQTAVLHSTDNDSVWNGATLNYKQIVELPVNFNAAGVFRYRICVGATSLTTYYDSRYIS